MPSGMTVTIDDRSLAASLRLLATKAADVRPVLDDIADDFLAMEDRLFASHGASAGSAWQPKADGGSASLRGRRARMERSLTERRSRGSVRRVTRSGLVIGSTHPLAHLHQGGTSERYVRSWRGEPLARPRYAGRLPARTVVHVGQDDKARWIRMLRDWTSVARTFAPGL